jgi:hypothetical protein
MCDWIRRDGLFLSAPRRIFSDVSLAVSTVLETSDAHVLDRQQFGVKPLSAYTVFRAGNEAKFVKPLKIGDQVLNVCVALKDPSSL